jgi:predicted nucleotidyltransferase
MISFRSQITQKILTYYFLDNKERRYLQELAKILSLDPGNLSRKLQELEEEGLFQSESVGNQKYYFLNLKYSFLTEIKKIFKVQYGLNNLISSALKNLKGLDSVYLFGSAARDGLKQGSDIDLLLIGEHNTREAKKKLLPLQNELRREINVVDLTNKELKKKQREKDELLSEIFHNKYIKII